MPISESDHLYIQVSVSQEKRDVFIYVNKEVGVGMLQDTGCRFTYGGVSDVDTSVLSKISEA